MSEANLTITCRQCGAGLAFEPGLQSLKCGHCGALNEVAVRAEAIEELDFQRFLAEQAGKEETVELATLTCDGCGASSTLDPHVTSGTCPFCGTNLVIKTGSTSTQLKPKSILPFAIDRKAALERLQGWLSGLWFAPFGFQQAYKGMDRFTGVYIPYWTYDAHAETDYAGERGEHYYTTESYTAQENGRSVTRTRQVRHTRWWPASGQVALDFDDILVLASKSLPEKHTAALEPWDLQSLVPFDEKFLAGFRTETYQIKVDEGYERAGRVMSDAITQAVQQDIGGDEQRIHSMTTRYSAITFKHILLPIWISAFRYGEKVFRFVINGRTGEVQGERPWSWAKILLLVVAVLGIAAVVAILSQ